MVAVSAKPWHDRDSSLIKSLGFPIYPDAASPRDFAPLLYTAALYRRFTPPNL
ncbi:MAG: hypothetical protein HC795_11170 [Coleofasciculaceae cyanobacterium RL_1_1]|nr:hypothetical protein [Coleofasciculaceae cyanobacterium RL_1_1]